MPRKIYTNRHNLSTDPLPAEFAAAQATSYVAQNLLKEKPSYDSNENKLLDMIDDKKLLAEMLTEFLPVFRKIKSMRNLDEQLAAISRMAPYILAKTMMFGSSAESRGAANDVLNRVQGKPIERQMSMTMQVNSMTEAEIDNELRRLESKFVEEAKTGTSSGEGKALGGDEGREVRAESSPEALHGVEGKD